MVCTVSGTAGLPDGTVFRGAVFQLVRSPKLTYGYDGRVVLPVPFSTVVDVEGGVLFDANPGTYEVTELTQNIKFFLNVPNAATANFVDCVEAATVVPTPSAIQDVFDARDAAEAAAAAAEAVSGIAFTSRADVVTWVATEAVPDGTVINAGGLSYYKSTGATAISDMADWLPFGDASPNHFGTNTTPGTTDMTLGVQEAYAYLNGLGGGVLDGRDEVFALSTMIDLTGHYYIKTVNCEFTAIGAWGVDPQFFKVVQTTAEMTYMVWERCSFEGAQVCNGIWVANAGAVSIQHCRMHGIPAFAVKSTTKATELRIQNNDFRQWNYGEAGFDVEANRTATLINLETADYIVSQNVCAYGYQAISTATRGPGQVHENHFYNGAQASSTFETRNATFSSPNVQIQGNYFDNGIVRLDAADLDGTAGMGVVGNHFHKSGTGTNTYTLEIFGGVASDLNGLLISSNTFTSGSGVLFTGTFEADDMKQWRVFGNVQTDGTEVSGLPTLSLGLTLNADRVNGWNIGGSEFVWTPYSSDDATIFNFSRAATFMVDYDNNSGTTVASTMNFGANGTSYWQMADDGTFIFGLGQASGGGPIANFAWSGDKLIIRGANSAGTGTDSTTRLEYDPAEGGWISYGGFRVESVVNGLGVPWMTTVDRDAMVQANGDVIYNTTDSQIQGRVAGSWVDLGGGGGNAVAVSMAFGGTFTDKAQTVVTGQTWVAAGSKIVADVLTPSGTDPDEMYLLNFRPVISDIVAGDGFTVTLYSEAQARGDYTVNCIGA